MFVVSKVDISPKKIGRLPSQKLLRFRERVYQKTLAISSLEKIELQRGTSKPLPPPPHTHPNSITYTHTPTQTHPQKHTHTQTNF